MSDGASAPVLRRHWLGRPGWASLALVAAALVVIPVAMLVTGILEPDTQMWREQWDTRLPNQIVATSVLLIGVVTVSTLLGVALAWLVSAYSFPGRRVCHPCPRLPDRSIRRTVQLLSPHAPAM